MSSSVSGHPANSATSPWPLGRGLRAALSGVAALSLSLAAAPAHGAEAAPGLALASASLLQAPGAALAQAPADARRATPEVTSQTMRATRAELTAAMEAAERAAARASGRDRERAQSEATAIRSRLRTGDFRPGDRISLSIGGDTVTRELAVREGPQIELPFGIPPLSLGGVLRAEVSDAMLTHLRRYIREPDARVRPLQRLNIVGAVTRPGVYWVASDLALAEVIMRAGGPQPGAKTDRIVVTRGGREVLDRKTYSRLVREGRTVEESNVMSGDELRLPEGGQRNWTQIATITFFAVSGLTAVLALIRSSYQ